MSISQVSRHCLAAGKRRSLLRLASLLATTSLSIVNGGVAAGATSTPAATGASDTTPRLPHAGAAEQVTVTGHAANPNGVTRTAPGGGLMTYQTTPKSVQTITRDYISKQSPTQSPQSLLQMLPSANVSTQDPYGLISGQVSVRGLSSAQIGWLLDGMPLNDIATNAFFANEVLDSEDTQEVALTPGSANIDTPTVSASGGIVSMQMRAPAAKEMAYVSMSTGSDKLNREFVRLDTGELGNSGITAFVSASHTHVNDWRGPGGVEKKHTEFKIQKNFANGSFTGLEAIYNHQVSQNYLYPTQAQFRSVGDSVNYDATYGGITDVHYYKLNQNPYQNVVANAASHVVLSPRISIDETPYLWFGSGNNGGASTLTEDKTYAGNALVAADLNGDGRITPGVSALVYSPAWSQQIRLGNTAKLSLTTTHNTVFAGWWYEWSNKEQKTAITQVDQATGGAASIWGQDSYIQTLSGQPYNANYTNTFTQINMVFLGDTLRLLNNRLTLTAGFKDAMVSRKIYNYVPGAGYNTDFNTNEPLPQVTGRLKIDRKNQVYVTGATNFRTPASASLINVFSTTTGRLATAATSPKSEYSIEEEIGYRYQGERILFDASFFNYNFTNRLLSLNAVQNGATVTETVNAGGQTSRGVDLQLGTTPILRYFRPYVSFEYLHATIDNNLKVGNDYLPTTGRTQIMSPKFLSALGIDYDDGTFFANLNLKYVGAQYSTFMNDEKMPDYVTNNITLGYRPPSFGAVHHPQIQLNMANLTGTTVRNGVYSFTNNAKATRGVFGTTIAASAPTYYVQPGFAAIVTVSSAF